MNHKRRRPKSRRAGCLLCKPHKANGAKGRAEHQTLQDRKSRERVRSDLSELDVPGATGFRKRSDVAERS